MNSDHHHSSQSYRAIGVVTVTYNSARVIDEFLSCLQGQTYDAFTVWAVDNKSSDSTVSKLRDWSDPRLRMICNADNRGVAAANNQGINAALAAGCEYVLLINNDVRFENDLLASLVKGFSAFQCDMVVPLIYYAEPNDRIWCAGGVFRERFGMLPIHCGVDEEDVGQFTPRRIAYAPTCCTLIKRVVFEKIGAMDERYFVYADDSDFMYRAWRAGLSTMLLPHVKLWHKVSSLTGKGSPFSQHYLARNRALFLKKHFGTPIVMYYTALYRAYYLVRFLCRLDDRAAMVRKQRAWTEGLMATGREPIER